MLKFDSKKVSKHLPVTHRIAEHQEEYITLPANIQKGIVAFSFRLSFLERLKCLAKGKIFVSLVTFNSPMQPIHINVSEKDFELNHKYTVDELGVGD